MHLQEVLLLEATPPVSAQGPERVMLQATWEAALVRKEADLVVMKEASLLVVLLKVLEAHPRVAI